MNLWEEISPAVPMKRSAGIILSHRAFRRQQPPAFSETCMWKAAEPLTRPFTSTAAVPEEERSVLLFEEGLEAASLRDAVNALTERHPGVCGAFSGNDREGYRFVLGSRTEDAREACRILREAFAARGGGKPDMVQGSVSASREELERLLKGR